MSLCTVYGSSLFGIDYVENEADFLAFLSISALLSKKKRRKGWGGGGLLRQRAAGG